MPLWMRRLQVPLAAGNEWSAARNSLGDINRDGKADFIASVRDEVGDFLADLLRSRTSIWEFDDPANFVGQSEATIVFGRPIWHHATSHSIASCPLATTSTFGTRSLISTPGDYNGDGIADIAVAVFRETPPDARSVI